VTRSREIGDRRNPQPRVGTRNLRHRTRRLLAHIGVRLLAFNLLLLFLPAAALLYLDTYERQLLDVQERSMVQQARLLAAALSGGEELAADHAERVLIRLAQRQESRLRVVDPNGRVVADSSLLGPRREPGENEGAGGYVGTEESVRDEPLYRLGALLHRIYRWIRPTPEPPPDRPGLYRGEGPLTGPAVRDALAGRYGADLVAVPGSRSVMLHSGIPITGGDDSVLGAVLVSRSTSRILAALYEVRLGIFQVFLASVGVAVLLSLLLSGTIARPLQKLRNQAAALLDHRGRITGRFRGTVRLDEIGDLARALSELTRRLEEHQRFTESFASDVSHELKNPLASLRTATEMLTEAESETERRRFAHMALQSVARLEHLLSAVGEIGRIDAELEEEAAEPVPVGELVRSLVTGFRLRHPRGPELTAELPDERLRVVASPDRLAQVVENLLDNAVSFTPPEGRVEVSVARRDGRAVIAVSDTGPGIPEAHLGRLFDRFFSYRPGEADDPRSGSDGHNGLGLAIARAIVERYGGEIRAENRPEGGARFELELPVGKG
jgi:two-component system sensor histidine kinase ChvG